MTWAIVLFLLSFMRQFYSYIIQFQRFRMTILRQVHSHNHHLLRGCGARLFQQVINIQDGLIVHLGLLTWRWYAFKTQFVHKDMASDVHI